MSGAPLYRAVAMVPEDAARRLVPALDGAGVDTWSLFEGPDGWQAEVLFAGEPDAAALDRLARLFAEAGAGEARLDVAALPDIDWLAENRRQFPPVRAGRYFVHGTLEPTVVPAGAVAIVLDAGRAFGTGRHATTHLCLEALDGVARRRRRVRRVLDLGCGAGVLAIAAARTWPAAVLAADIDPAAIAVTRHNARRNRVAARLRAVESDGPRNLAGGHDLILANILARPLVAWAPALARALAPGGTLVLSGLLDGQAAGVLERYRAQGLHLRRRLSRDGWTALVLGR